VFVRAGFCSRERARYFIAYFYVCVKNKIEQQLCWRVRESEAIKEAQGRSSHRQRWIFSSIPLLCVCIKK
jgi:hypothetical protein